MQIAHYRNMDYQTFSDILVDSNDQVYQIDRLNSKKYFTNHCTWTIHSSQNSNETNVVDLYHSTLFGTVNILLNGTVVFQKKLNIFDSGSTYRTKLNPTTYLHIFIIAENWKFTYDIDIRTIECGNGV